MAKDSDTKTNSLSLASQANEPDTTFSKIFLGDTIFCKTFSRQNVLVNEGLLTSPKETGLQTVAQVPVA